MYFARRRLGDVCEIHGGYAFKSRDLQATGVPLVRIGDIKNPVAIGERTAYLPESYLVKYSRFEVEKGDVLIALTGTPGKYGIYECEQKALLNQRVGRVRVKSNELHERFLYHYLALLEPQIFARASGVAQLNVSPGTISEIEIFLPTLETQKRIADVLDKAQELIDKRKQQIEMLDEFLQSVFLDMFGDPGVNPKNWCIRPFSYFAKIDTRMVKDFQDYWEMPHIGIENIERDSGRLIGYKLVKDAGLTSGKYVFNDSHIIYSKIRPNLNKVALPEFSGLCSADAYPVLVDERHTNRYFFAHILRSNYFLDYILRHSSRTNIPKVNKRQLQLFHCICPPIRLQNEFAELVVRTEEQREVLLKSLAEMENAFNSIVQRAFKGELFN